MCPSDKIQTGNGGIWPEDNMHRAHWQPGLSLIFLLAAIFIGGFLLPRQMHAAMALNYFDVLVGSDTITLEWSTASEHEVLGFELYYKEERESQSQYRFVGEQVAQGNKERGAIYRVEMTEGLRSTVPYCFRLKEITLNGDRGEIIDRCGYGQNITPTSDIVAPEGTEVITPSATLTVAQGLTDTTSISPTVVQPIIVTSMPTATTTISQPTDTPTSADNIEPEATFTPTPDQSVQSTPGTEVESPLPTPTPLTNASNQEVQAAGIENQDITEDQAIVDMSADQSITRTATAEAPQSPLPTAIAVANPPYIVLTTTPTAANNIVEATFTPFPTIIAAEDPNIVLAVLPNTQNLMIVLLCGVFSGASGLGILGLVTTLLYMRSRTSEHSQKRETQSRNRTL